MKQLLIFLFAAFVAACSQPPVPREAPRRPEAERPVAAAVLARAEPEPTWPPEPEVCAPVSGDWAREALWGIPVFAEHRKSEGGKSHVHVFQAAPVVAGEKPVFLACPFQKGCYENLEPGTRDYICIDFDSCCRLVQIHEIPANLR